MVVQKADDEGCLFPADRDALKRLSGQFFRLISTNWTRIRHESDTKPPNSPDILRYRVRLSGKSRRLIARNTARSTSPSSVPSNPVGVEVLRSPPPPGRRSRPSNRVPAAHPADHRVGCCRGSVSAMAASARRWDHHAPGIEQHGAAVDPEVPPPDFQAHGLEIGDKTVVRVSRRRRGTGTSIHQLVEPCPGQPDHASHFGNAHGLFLHIHFAASSSVRARGSQLPPAWSSFATSPTQNRERLP